MIVKIDTREDQYYVYMYMDQDNVPFYVGKGRGERCDPSTRYADGAVGRVITFLGVKNVTTFFLHKNLYEAEAFLWEKYWIDAIGRHSDPRGVHTGPLVNVLPGFSKSLILPDDEVNQNISDEVNQKFLKLTGQSLRFYRCSPMETYTKEKK